MTEKVSPYLVVAIKDWDSENMSLMKECFYQITKKNEENGWLYGIGVLGDKGWVPKHYVEQVDIAKANVRSEHWKKWKKGKKGGLASQVTNAPGQTRHSLSKMKPISSSSRSRRSQKNIEVISANKKVIKSTPDRQVGNSSPYSAYNRGKIEYTKKEKKERYENGLSQGLDVLSELEGKPKTEYHMEGRRRTQSKQRRRVGSRNRQHSRPEGASSSTNIPPNFNFEGSTKLDFLMDEVEEEKPRWHLVCYCITQLLPDLREKGDSASELADDILDYGGFDVILEVLESHCGGSNEYEISCLLTLSELALRDLSSLYGEVDPFPIIMTTLEKYDEDNSILMGLHIMTKLLGVASYRVLMGKHPPLLDKLMTYLQRGGDVHGNTQAVLACIARDQQQLFEDRHIELLVQSVKKDDAKSLTNVLRTLLNLCQLEIVVENMVRANVFGWLVSLLDSKDKKVKDTLWRVIKNIFITWKNSSNMALSEVCDLFRALLKSDYYRKLCFNVMSMYTKNCSDKLMFLEALLTTRCLDPILRGHDSEEKDVNNVLSILWHLVYHTKSVSNKHHYFALLLNSELMQNLYDRGYRDGCKSILKIICFFIINNKFCRRVLAKHLGFVKVIVGTTATMQFDQLHHKTLRICFELARDKKYYKFLMDSGVLNFANRLTVNHHIKTIELFLGLILRLSGKDSTPEVQAGLKKRATLLNSFLDAIKTFPGLEGHVTVCKSKMKALQKRDYSMVMPQDEDDFVDSSEDSSDDMRSPRRQMGRFATAPTQHRQGGFSYNMQDHNYTFQDTNFSLAASSAFSPGFGQSLQSMPHLDRASYGAQSYNSYSANPSMLQHTRQRTLQNLELISPRDAGDLSANSASDEEAYSQPREKPGKPKPKISFSEPEPAMKPKISFSEPEPLMDKTASSPIPPTRRRGNTGKPAPPPAGRKSKSSDESNIQTNNERRRSKPPPRPSQRAAELPPAAEESSDAASPVPAALGRVRSAHGATTPPSDFEPGKMQSLATPEEGAGPPRRAGRKSRVSRAGRKSTAGRTGPVLQDLEKVQSEIAEDKFNLEEVTDILEGDAEDFLKDADLFEMEDDFVELFQIETEIDLTKSLDAHIKAEKVLMKNLFNNLTQKYYPKG